MRGLCRVRNALDRPRLWKVTAVLSAIVFCGLLVAVAQGSVTVIGHRPATSGAARAASWERWCTAGHVRVDRRQLAFCARAEGMVIATTHGPSPAERHVALVCDFRLLIVLVPDGMAAPSFGSREVAIGPLLRARNGQREVQAFRLQGA